MPLPEEPFIVQELRDLVRSAQSDLAELRHEFLKLRLERPPQLPPGDPAELIRGAILRLHRTLEGIRMRIP